MYTSVKFCHIIIEILMKDESTLVAKIPGQGNFELVPFEPHKFILGDIGRITLEFIMDNDKVTILEMN